MSLTVANAVTGITQAGPQGNLRVGPPKLVTFDSSYLEGGEELSAGQLGLSTVIYAVCEIQSGSEEATVRPTSAYYTPKSGATPGKLHLIDSATGKEVASTKDMSKVKVRVIGIGY